MKFYVDILLSLIVVFNSTIFVIAAMVVILTTKDLRLDSIHPVILPRQGLYQPLHFQLQQGSSKLRTRQPGMVV